MTVHIAPSIRLVWSDNCELGWEIVLAEVDDTMFGSPDGCELGRGNGWAETDGIMLHWLDGCKLG